MLKASEHETDSERSFLLMAIPLSGLPVAVSSLYAGMCLALTREYCISSIHPGKKRKCNLKIPVTGCKKIIDIN